MKIQGVKKMLSNLSLIHWSIGVAVAISTTGIYFWKYLRSQLVFGSNLKRRVYFLKTSNLKNLQTQKDKLKNLELFNIEEDIKNISRNLTVLQNLDGNAIYIVGYDKNYNQFEALFDVAERKKNPIIIFANRGEIENDSHWRLINNYIYCDVANTTNRLAIITLNILKIVRP